MKMKKRTPAMCGGDGMPALRVKTDDVRGKKKSTMVKRKCTYAQPAPVTPMGPGVPCLPQPEYL